VPTTTIDGLSVYIDRLQRHGAPYRNDDGETHVDLPERLPHVHYEQATTFICGGGERLHDIVIARYNGIVEDPIDMLDIVAQYQEEPILDTSIPLPAGLVLELPPPLYRQDVAYGDSLAEYPKIA
jgi:hypothetical protein